MQITYRIPSKKVPYGYIEVTWEKADSVMPDPVAMAEDYAQFILDYQASEVQAFENPGIRQIKKTDSSVDDAQKILNEGLGGVTEVDGDDPAAPWNKTSDTNETSVKAQPSDDDWDF